MTDNVTQTRFEYKNITGNKTITTTSTIALPELTFTGLVVGRTYRLTMYGWIWFADNGGGADSLAQFIAYHNGAAILECRYRDDTEPAGNVRYVSGTSSLLFTATNTDITFDFYAAVSSQAILLGPGNAPPSHAILEELPFHTEVSDF